MRNEERRRIKLQEQHGGGLVLRSNANSVPQYQFTPTPIGHPCANPVERCNRTIKPMIVAFTSQNQRDWNFHLPNLKLAYNTAVHTALGVSPFYLNHGRDPHLILDQYVTGEMTETDTALWKARIDRMDELRYFVERHMLKARDRTRKQYEKRFSTKLVDLKIGDQVYYLNKCLSKKADGYSAKLVPKYAGPAVITEIISPLVVKLADSSGFI
ncbi:uncharacterized protein LOC141537908 [Cotesia typhae]|uniref:uncharacterized protein LOC141537908 n=1 Tax=Cotesia typhae TaxID=2053667 RepID=UPI003D693369